MKQYYKLGMILLFVFSFSTINGQDSSKIFFTTGTGIIKSPGALHHIIHPSLAFNSGIEFVNRSNWYLQASADFNSLKYNQHIKEDGSPFLFKNTSSSLIMLAISAGKNFHWGHRKWLTAVYTGGGYLNIGEPRLISVSENIIRQEVSRKTSAFGKAGVRLGYRTKSKFLQTIYIDGAWWISPLKIQQARLSGVSIFAGLRMGL
ncbi:MAG: hypothetical protein QM791_01505 [Ferruginibacter sp.]